MDLDEMADSVETCDDFVAFVQSLLVDLRDHASEWENPSLPDFLEAMAAWTADTQAHRQLTGKKPLGSGSPWEAIAEILMGARNYE